MALVVEHSTQWPWEHARSVISLTTMALSHDVVDAQLFHNLPYCKAIEEYVWPE